MLAHQNFSILASAPLFRVWVGQTEWLLCHHEHCNSSVAATAMFELHAAANPDVEEFLRQINLLLEAGRQEPDLAILGRAMVVGLVLTLERARAK
jgi:hypothetical protein